MEDQDLIRTYATAMFMLAFLDEWEKSERIGVVAKIYNTITKKHNVFHDQILQAKLKKRQKYSKKCSLFVVASSYAITAWDECIQQTKHYKVSANTAIHNLFRLNKENFERIYGLKEEDFKKLNSDFKCGVTLSSCKVARILHDRLDFIISDNQKKIKNIYNVPKG